MNRLKSNIILFLLVVIVVILTAIAKNLEALLVALK